MHVRKQQLELDSKRWTGSKLGKEYIKAEYIMRNIGLDEAQAGIKIAGRNINNLRYADDTTLMAESEELKSLLMKVKEESEKVKNSTYRKLRSWHRSHHFMANRWGNSGNSVRLYFSGLQKITTL